MFGPLRKEVIRVVPLAHLSAFLAAGTSHSLISTPPVASVLPSGLYTTDWKEDVCPWRVAVFLPVATSQSLRVSSQLAEASVLPSGLNTTECTTYVCPLRVAR